MKQFFLVAFLPFLFLLLQCDKDDIQIRQLMIDLGSCQSDNTMIGPKVYFNFSKWRLPLGVPSP